jgi:serine/threonine-protein kinase RsbW
MLDGLGFDLWPVGIVISEAVTNVALHAYRDGASGRVQVSARLRGTVLTLVVADDGVGMAPNPDSPGLGVGLSLIGSLTEHMEVQREDGTTLVARLRLVAGA